MSDTLYRVQYGETTIEYDLTFASRKTLAINVHPDLRVSVTAPEGTEPEAVQSRVRKRASWILRQQQELELYLPQTPPRQYVSGETHYYLGRQYRLKVIQDDAEWVKLDRGHLYVRTTDKTDAAQVEALLDRWYMRQAWRVYHERLRELLPRFERFDLPEFELRIKKLEARWGSCTAGGIVTLNLRLIQVSKKYIDYVIVHELCHLIEHNHSKRFYLLLDHLLPDWRERRWELNASDFV